MHLQGLKINFLGDSITEGAGASAQSQCFVSVLGRHTGAEVRNYGIGGTRIARRHVPHENPRYDQDFCQRVPLMAPDADAVVVFGGTNDYGHGDAPLGTMADRTPDTFYGALHTLYTSLLTRYPDAIILVITPTHRLQEDVPDSNGLPLKAYVDAIREVAEAYSLPVLDLYATSGLQPGVPAIQARYMPDGLHPNDAGHARLADRIQKALERL